MQPLNDWLKDLDRICWKKLGVSYEDVEDFPWKDYYNEGLSAREALDAFLEESDYYL